MAIDPDTPLSPIESLGCLFKVTEIFLRDDDDGLLGLRKYPTSKPSSSGSSSSREPVAERCHGKKGRKKGHKSKHENNNQEVLCDVFSSRIEVTVFDSPARAMNGQNVDLGHTALENHIQDSCCFRPVVSREGENSMPNSVGYLYPTSVRDSETCEGPCQEMLSGSNSPELLQEERERNLARHDSLGDMCSTVYMEVNGVYAKPQAEKQQIFDWSESSETTNELHTESKKLVPDSVGHWEAVWDAFYGRNYFYNVELLETTWYPPSGMEHLF